MKNPPGNHACPSFSFLAKPAMSHYWSAVVHGLHPYHPGEQPKLAHLIKLNTNENPYPPSPKAVAAIRAALGEDGACLARYPDPQGERFKEAVVRHYARYGIHTRQVFVGNSSDEVLAHVFQALFRHEAPLLLPDVTYSFYPVYCGLYGIAFETVPVAPNLAIQSQDYLQRPNGGIIFPNPNAPTGKALPLAEIERIVSGNVQSAVVIDEAYVDFGAQTAIALVQQYPNLLVVQTLSKSRALAGLRVGFAVGHPDLIEGLERVKNCFNSYLLDHLAIAGAAAALDDEEWFERNRRAVMEGRAALTEALVRLGFQVIPSEANFVFARHPGQDAAQLAQKLRERSIIVRHFALPRIDQYLRITVGTPAEYAALIDALTEILR
jgi:histidinol-phosphate aminotransferase